MLSGIVALVAILIFFVVFQAERDYRRGFSINKGNSYMEGIRIVNKKNGVDAWTISARRADFTKDETVAQLNSVTIDIKKEGAVLDAASGQYNINTRELRLEKDIAIRQKDSTISTESLSWNPADGTLSSDGLVIMKGNKFRIEGEGLKATEDKKIKLMRNVKATFF